nr:hypothetical protein CFP56_56027 [Quercus suber]
MSYGYVAATRSLSRARESSNHQCRVHTTITNGWNLGTSPRIALGWFAEPQITDANVDGDIGGNIDGWESVQTQASGGGISNTYSDAESLESSSLTASR